MASYYCTGNQYELRGQSKLVCKPNGSWDGTPPRCIISLVTDNPPPPPLQALPVQPKTRRPFVRPRPEPGINKRLFTRRPFIKDRHLPKRPKKEDFVAPIDNEIPDSANVQANPGQGANVPNPVENERGKKRQAQLNLGNFIINK